MEKFNSNLVAQEIVLYLTKIALLSKIKGENSGSVTNDTSFTFGKPSKADYVLNEDGTLDVEISFSSNTWHWASNDETQNVDVNLDLIEEKIDTFKWMNNHQKGFNRLLKRDCVDFEELRNILFNKYGIAFELSYDEKTYSETRWNGSDDNYSSAVAIFNVINSEIFIRGNVKNLIEQERVY